MMVGISTTSIAGVIWPTTRQQTTFDPALEQMRRNGEFLHGSGFDGELRPGMVLTCEASAIGLVP